VSNASTLLGLLLVLVTLFTSEQAKSLDNERSRAGGGRRSAYRRIGAIAVALAIVTATSLVSLWPLAGDVKSLCCGLEWDPILGVFELVWILLLPLLIWQFGLAWSAWRA
jgi:hypothetical protein